MFYRFSRCHFLGSKRFTSLFTFENYLKQHFSLVDFLLNLVSKFEFDYCLFVSRTHSLSSPSFYLQNTGRFSKTFMAAILVQTAKYCLPQITYLLIHVFLINFRQGNVKLVLLKEFKPIILHVASKNQLFCECKFKTAMKMIRMEQLIFLSFFT